MDCPICMSGISFNLAVSAAPCGHVFHGRCLNDWMLQSQTCPQCRSRCVERDVRRLHLSAGSTDTTADIDSVDLDGTKEELRQLESELEAKRKATMELRERNNAKKRMLLKMEAQVHIANAQLGDANSGIASVKSEIMELRALEAELTRKIQQSSGMEDVESLMDSSLSEDIAELLKDEPDVEVLAKLVSVNKRELVKAEKSRDEVQNNQRVCEAENAKLNKNINELTERISTLESDNSEPSDQ